MKYGFYCRMYGKDCFIETKQERISRRLAIDFINKVQNKMNDFSNIGEREIEYVLCRMKKATMEFVTLRNGLSYIEIRGKEFGGCGVDPCENPFENEYFIYVKG